ncbi:MAG: prephenate dehydrogenase [Terriglobia bacterium]|jgi:prephenate dehydrogenase|nr:prephenate dehydrogenase [Terriglobia bacterium]
MIRQITIIGTGLIGGSLGLALKERGFAGRIVGCDRPEVLERAKERGIIDAADNTAETAVEGSDIIVLATPVSSIIDHIARLGPLLPPNALLTDTGSTKAEIVRQAQRIFGDSAALRFLAGHPMAGKERGGIGRAEANLFSGATWILTPSSGTLSIVSPEFIRGRHGEWIELLESIGARIVVLHPERHDKLCTYTSHLPQLISTALASTVVEATENDAAVSAVAGGGIRGMVRLSRDDYPMWRDVALTNTKNLHDALLQMEQKLAHIRENLKTRQLQEEFDRAHELDLDTPPEGRQTEDDTDPPRFL